MNSTLIYIAGPMTGYPDFNYPVFKEAEKQINNQDHNLSFGMLQEEEAVAISPVTVDEALGFDKFITEDNIHMHLPMVTQINCQALSNCQKVALLPNWWKSKGTILEVAASHRLGKEMYELGFWTLREISFKEIFRKIYEGIDD